MFGVNKKNRVSCWCSDFRRTLWKYCSSCRPTQPKHRKSCLIFYRSHRYGFLDKIFTELLGRMGSSVCFVLTEYNKRHTYSITSRIVSRVNIRSVQKKYALRSADRMSNLSVTPFLHPRNSKNVDVSCGAQSFFPRTGREIGNFGRLLQDLLNYDVIKISSRDSRWFSFFLPWAWSCFSFFLFFVSWPPRVVGVPVGDVMLFKWHQVFPVFAFFAVARWPNLVMDNSWESLDRVLGIRTFCFVARS